MVSSFIRVIIILHNRCLWQIWSLVTATSVYKPRCAAMLIMIDFSTFVVFQLGNIKGGSLLVESVLWISRRTKSSFFLLSLAVLCRFVFFYISFVSCRLPRLTVFRLSEEVVRKPELFFVSTLCVLSNVSHLHSEEEGNHLLGWDELFWKEENHTNNLSSIQMFYFYNYIRFLYLSSWNHS